MFKGKDGDYRIMMKAATAVMILAITCTVLLLIAGWIALVLMSVAFVWVGISTMLDGNTVMGLAEFVVGVLGFMAAVIIAVFYYDATC